jgi:bacillithiol system protein YtxJ
MTMNWIALTTIEQLAVIDAESAEQPVMILKHSTRCSISSAALARLERQWNAGSGVKTYFLDLIAHRDVSNAIAAHYDVEHQSPQVLVIKNGASVYDESHMSISAEEILDHL